MSWKRLLVGGAFVLLYACGSEPGPLTADSAEKPAQPETPTASAAEAIEPQTLRDVLEGDERFSILVAALQASDLLITVDEEGPLTVFAPSNAAFEELPSALSVDVLTAPENKTVLRDLLAYHVVSRELSTLELQGQRLTVPAVNGDPLIIDGQGAVISVGGAVVVVADIKAANGVIHVIDTVLLPPTE